MNKKIRIAVIFGGKSAEHEVSLQSAKNVINALDRKKYEPILIGIDKNGKWHLQDESQYLLNASNPKLIALNKNNQNLALVPDEKEKTLITLEGSMPIGQIDVAFPVLHGTFGEDGTMQGLLKLLDIPFVGPSVLGSAIGMDKEVTKRLLKEGKIPTPNFLVAHNEKEISFAKAKKKLGLPMFVKPANMGSSVGINKVRNNREFLFAVKDAFLYDRKILIEEAIDGREIECAVLGNEKPVASVLGEIIPHHEFYSYEAKYIDENGAGLEIPAKLPKTLAKKIQKIAVEAFKTLQLEGMARVDFFLKKNGEALVNEANTIPGFTKISMYPKLWEFSGIPYSKLLDILIQLAIERFSKEKKLKTSK